MRRQIKKHIYANSTVRYLKNGKYTKKESEQRKLAKVSKIHKCSYCGKRHDCCMLNYEPNRWQIKTPNRNGKKNRFYKFIV